MKQIVKVIGVGMMAVWAGTLTAKVMQGSPSIPNWINYQGRLTKPSGAVVNDGAYNVNFKLVNDGNAVIWEDTKTVTVKQGIFSTRLGYPGGLPVQEFQNSLRLRVTMGSTVLPDQELGSVGYAMMAHSVVDGAITSNKIANGAITTEKLSVSALKLPVYSTSGPAPSYWPVPEGGVFTVIPGHSLQISVPTDSYLDISYSGLVSQTLPGRATYTNVHVNGNPTLMPNGTRHLGGYRAGGPWGNAAISVVVPVGPGNHTVDVRATNDGEAGSATVHSGFLRVMVIPR